MTPPPSDDHGTRLMGRPETGRASIESLVALHERDVRSALRRVLGRSQEEDDLVQEVFTRLVVRLRQPGELCVGAWVRGVAHNLAVDEIRRRRPVPVDDTRLDRMVPSSAEEAVVGADLYERVVQGAHGLPDRQRAALAAALANGGPNVGNVADRLGVSVHAAESLLSRARVGLRNHLAMSGCETGSARRSLVGALAVAVAVVAAVLRRWRMATALAVVGGTLAGFTLLPATGDPGGGRPPASGAPAAAVDAGAAPAPGPGATADGEAPAPAPAAHEVPATAAPTPRPPAAGEAPAPSLALPDLTLPEVDVDRVVGDVCAPTEGIVALAEGLGEVVGSLAPVAAAPTADTAAAPCATTG